MRPAFALLFASAAALLLITARRDQQYIADSTGDPDIAPDWEDEVQATISNAVNAVNGTDASAMVPSAELLGMLKRGEALRLQRYRLGDGGWTIGYGRYYPDGGALPPESIDRATAEAWFAEDVEARGARWVRAYVTVPLTQNQFDALVSMAYNLSPKSFKRIADAVNAGEDPEAAALQYVRVGTDLERGLRNRRAREIALYRLGTYA